MPRESRVPNTGPRVRNKKLLEPWVNPDPEPSWIPTYLGNGRTLWRPPRK